jgi:hypothetical protein
MCDLGELRLMQKIVLIINIIYNIILILLITDTVIRKLFYFVRFIQKTDRNNILNTYTDITKTYI